MRKFDVLNTKLAKQIEGISLDKVDAEKAYRDFNKKMAELSDNSIITKSQEAVLFAQCVHMQFLKSPSQAKFPDFDDFKVEEENGTYTVTGYVDAPNSYGAVTRGKVKIHLSYINGKWKYLADPEEIANTVYGIVGIAVFVVVALIILLW